MCVHHYDKAVEKKHVHVNKNNKTQRETLKHRVLSTRWQRSPAGIDMERNCITGTLCILRLTITLGYGLLWLWL